MIVTVPSYGEPDPSNVVVGKNLHDFLRFGLIRGYFALEQLTYYRDLTLRVYASKDWQPTEDWHGSVGFCPGAEKKRLLDFLAERLELTPLFYSTRDFEELQAQHKSLLVYPEKDEW